MTGIYDASNKTCVKLEKRHNQEKRQKNWQIQIKQEKLNTTEFHKLTREQKNTELKYVSCLWKTKKKI